MKKVGIITIIGLSNFGNRLQNYALSHYIESLGFECETIKNYPELNNPIKGIRYILYKVYLNIAGLRNKDKEKKFSIFNNNIKMTRKTLNLFNKKSFKYDYYVVGSDQVWNPYFGGINKIDLLSFTNKTKISYAASIGVNSISNLYEKRIKKYLPKFKAISVREEQAKTIIDNIIDNDVEVLLDPTMLLDKNDWNKVASSIDIKNKYVLNVFLGKNQNQYIINKFAKDNNYDVINLLDKSDPYYISGPQDFISLIKNAELVCTDSFHSSVFPILYDVPFIVFDRCEANPITNSKNKMNSRIETLLKKFDLEDRKFNGVLNKDILVHNYGKAYKILEEERIKSKNYLLKALDK